MADIRIKDLTTTASSTASDDFIAVDGTTNGTRKLNAFSPTFGGNATVTGTLTVNSTLTANGPASGITVNGAGISLDTSGNSASLRFLDSGTPAFWLYKLPSDSNLYVRDMVNTRMQARFLPGATSSLATSSFYSKVEIDATTASTTTSSGALVVGNGTSGGLGVGGAITAGGGITSTNPGGVFQITGTGNTGASKELIFYRSDGGDTLNFGLTGSAYAGILTGLGNNEAYVYHSSSSAFRIFLGTAATNRFDFTSSQFKINPTTASTTTSSGALVVSGGVGVAGSINTDGTLRFNANSSLPGTGSLGISSTYGLNFYASTGSSYDFTVFSAAGQSILLVPTGTRNVSFSGTLTTVGNITSGAAITTSAPVGGAGLWELGLYSSTAPSATGYVTIEIGGTVYKLLASNV